jgi:hypothetical protein
MRWSDIPFDPPARTLRGFAAISCLILAGLAVWEGLHRHRPGAALACAVLAAIVGVVGLLAPARMRPIYVGMMVATFPIGWLVSNVLLLVLFVCLFTPLAWIFRLTGRDALDIRRPRGDATGWVPKAAARDLRSYFRQW